jgi:disulfide bond formation protein DsbB
LQRVGFAGVAFGLLLNVRYGQKPLHVGIVILAALFGMSVAGRHVLIHIAPGTGSYGSAVFGLHLYTWAFVLFGVSILGAAVLLILQPAQPQTGPSPLSAVATFAGWWVIALTLVNAITTFVECGPIECPANPTRYWLFG